MSLNQFKVLCIYSYKFVDYQSKINSLALNKHIRCPLKQREIDEITSTLIRKNSLINFLQSNEYNIESNFHSLGNSLRNKICAFIQSKCSKA
jgi:hypothetical protein